MRITCPKCQFKGLIDTAPLAFEARVACVRCGIVFDALLLADGIQTSLPPDDGDDATAQPVVPESDVQAEPLALDAEDVLALPQAPDTDSQTVEQSPMLEDVLPLPPAPDADSVAQEIVFADQTEGTTDAPEVVMEEETAQSLVEPQPPETAETAHAPNFQFDRPPAESLADYRQSMGTRLMRISPLWLLVCGLTFVSVIVLSNQFAKPADQPQPASNFNAPSNKATNQSSSQPLAPAATNSATTSVQEASQPIAPAPPEEKNETAAIGNKAETEAQSEQEATHAPGIVPVKETRDEPVGPAPQSDAPKGGGLTVQVGSYNVIEQANERVARLQAAGFDARVVAVELPKRGTWYRVQAGIFSSHEEATRYGNEMKAKGATASFIIVEAQDGK